MWPELPFAFWLSHVYEHTAMHLPHGFWTWLTHVTLSLSFHSLCVQCFCLPTTNFCTREQTSHSICIFPFWSCCNTHYLLADNSMARPPSPHSSFYVHALGFLTAYFTHHTFTHLLPIYWSPAISKAQALTESTVRMHYSSPDLVWDSWLSTPHNINGNIDYYSIITVLLQCH